MDVCRVFDDGDNLRFCGLVGFRVDDIGDIRGEHTGFSVVPPGSNWFSFHRPDRGKVEFSSDLEASLVAGIPDASSGFTSLGVPLPYCHEDSEWKRNI